MVLESSHGIGKVPVGADGVFVSIAGLKDRRQQVASNVVGRSVVPVVFALGREIRWKVYFRQFVEIKETGTVKIYVPRG